jgi:hypothetical protein
MLLIVDGERIMSSTLHNVTIEAKTAKVYNANNKEAIDKYGNDAANAVFVLEGAIIRKNKATGKAGTIIQVDSATVFGAAAANQQAQPKKDNPLYVVNGEVKTKVYVGTIAPEDIEKIDVLKDKNAIDKYGEAGKNGVVEITLKKVLPYKEMIELQKLKLQPKPSFPLMTKL